MTWQPRLPDSEQTLHERLIAALERDIADGVLQVGSRLPPHRELAHHLGIGIGTVTKAYAEAERKGLLIAHVGRGSFVAGAPRTDASRGDASTRIDMANNLPPLGPAEDRLAGTLSQLRRRPELTSYVGYAPAGGFESHRRAAAAWLVRTAGFDAVNWESLILCGGAQEATALVAAHLCKPGDTILTEAATFFGMKNLADYAGYKLQGVAMDAQGLDPEALDRAAQKGARVLYTIPTFQNPTGRIMDAARRADIARVARVRDLWIIEDDVYGGLLSSPRLTPLATLAPERTFYLNSASKTLAPGLRTGFLITPSATHFDQIIRAIRARYVTGSALGSLIATQWIEDGTADAILEMARQEMRARTALAHGILGTAAEPFKSEQSHLWLPMSELDAERTAGRALLNGVEVTSPSAPIVDRALISGLRLCLGAAPTRAALETGLRVVAAALSAGNTAPSRDGV